MSKQDRLEDWFDTIWTKGRTQEITRFIREDVDNAGIIPDMPLAPEELAELVALVHEKYGPPTFRFLKTVAQDDWLAALVEMVSPGLSGQTPVTVFGQVMVRFDGDMIGEIHSTFDNISFFEQRGQLPENTLVILLSGARLD